MTIKTINKTVTFEQRKRLQGLLFWLREKRLLINFNKCTKEIDETISYALDQCDKLGIPFSIQNIVLNYYNTGNIHIDILDVLQENNIETVNN